MAEYLSTHTGLRVDEAIAKIPDGNPGAKSVIVVNTNGKPEYAHATTGVSPNTIPIRDTAGRIQATAPVDVNDVTNKQYTDDNFVPKVTNTASTDRVYAIGANGEQKTRFIDDISCLPSRLAIYENINTDFDLGERAGTLFCPEPKFNYQTANKKYVDDNYLAKTQLSNGKEAGKIAIYYDQGQWPGTSDVGNGYLVSSDPVSPYHVVNKKYFDTNTTTFSVEVW